MLTHVDDLPEQLLGAIPETLPTYREEEKLWRTKETGEPLSIPDTFGTVLVRFIKSLIDQLPDAEAGDVLRRTFDFLEELMHDENHSVRAVVDVEVCRSFIDNENWPRVRGFMGPRTREAGEFMRRGRSL